MGVGFSLVVIAILAELISANRQLLEKIGYYQQLIEAKIDKGKDNLVD
jgi:uncharacterized protein YhdP